MEIKNDKNTVVAGGLRAGGILRRFRTGWLAALILLTVSCTEEPLPEGDGPQSGSDIAVTVNLTPEKLLMPGADADVRAVSGRDVMPTVRSAAGIFEAGESGGMSLELLAQPEAPATRASAELTIANAWLLQFDGEDSAAKLVRKRYLKDYTAGSLAEFLPGASQRIVVLANSYDPALCDGLVLQTATYADVMDMAGPAADAINANACVPMSGTTITTIEQGMQPLSISLKSIAAKVTLKVKVAQGMPVDGWTIQPQDLAPAYWMPDTGTGMWPATDRLTGDAMTATRDITLPVTDYFTYTCYLPINRRGTMTGTTAQQRKTNAPEGASYIKIYCDQINGNILVRKSYYIHLGANFTTDYNLRAHTHYTYLTTLLPEVGNDSRVGVEEHKVVQANCGLIVPGSFVFLGVADRVEKANTATPDLNLSWTLDTDYTPLVIWQDVQGLISEMNYNKTTGCLSVTTDAAKGAAGGNAVVGLFPSGTADPSEGNCIWSWHIWVTDYQPDGSNNYELVANQKFVLAGGGEVHTYGGAYIGKNPGKVMMDRNLGATGALYAFPTNNGDNYPTYGLFYQWGRKDPIPKVAAGTDKTTTSQETYNASGAATGYPILKAGPAAILEATQNPHVFYYKSNGGDWSSSSNTALWGDGTTKSVYDPCPEGWRIPPSGTWGDFNGSSFSKNSEWTGQNVDLSGKLYAAGSVMAFYPASGLRNEYGGLTWIGLTGYSWTSMASGSSGYNLYFSSGGVSNNHYHNRAYGYPVRCIQE